MPVKKSTKRKPTAYNKFVKQYFKIHPTTSQTTAQTRMKQASRAWKVTKKGTGLLYRPMAIGGGTKRKGVRKAGFLGPLLGALAPALLGSIFKR